MANYQTRSSTRSLAPKACYERPRQPQGPKRFTSAKPRACGISTAQPKVAKGTMVRMPSTTMNNAPQVTPVRSGSTLAAIQITTAFRHILTTAEGVSDSHVCAIIVRLALYPHPPAHEHICLSISERPHNIFFIRNPGNWNYCENGKGHKGSYDNGKRMTLFVYATSMPK